MKGAGQEILEQSRKRVAGARIPVDIALLDTLSRRLSERIEMEAKAWPADLIVLGTHGRRGVGRMLLGSDAEQIVRTSAVPVLLVRGRPLAAVEREPSASVAQSVAQAAHTGGSNPLDVKLGVAEVLRDGTRVVIRPICEGDSKLEARFIETLSPSSRRFRFLDSMKSPSDTLLRNLTVIDPSTDAAFIAVTDVQDAEREIGVARFSASPGRDDCEFAVTVGDEWQGKGLGTLLMKRLIAVAKERGLKSMHSSDAPDNELMRRFAEHLQFRHERDPEDARQVLYSVDIDRS